MSRIQENTLALVAAFLLTTLFSLAQIKILTTALTPGEVGMYAGSLAASAIFAAIVDFGFPQVLLRYAARYEALGVPWKVRGLGIRALGFATVLAVGLGLLVFGKREDLAGLFVGREIPASLFPWAFAFAAVGSLKAIAYGAMNGLRRMSIPVAIEQAGFFVATFGLFLLRDRLDPLLVFELNVAVGLAGLAVAAIVLSRLAASAAPSTLSPHSPGLVTPADAGFPERAERHSEGLVPYWAGSFVTVLLMVAMDNADRILVGTALPLATLSLFHIAAKVTHFVRRFLYIPIFATGPEVTRKWELGDPASLSRDLEILVKAQVALGLLFATGMALLARPAILAIATPSFLEAADLLSIFAFVVPIMSIYAPLQSALRSVGKIRPTAYAEALWLGTYLLTASALLRSMGVMGVPLSQVLASLVVLAYILWVFRRATGLQVRRGVLLRMLAFSGAVLLAASALSWHIPIRGLPLGILVGVALVLVFNFALVRGRFFDESEIARLGGLLSARWMRTALAFALAWPSGRMPVLEDARAGEESDRSIREEPWTR